MTKPIKIIYGMLASMIISLCSVDLPAQFLIPEAPANLTMTMVWQETPTGHQLEWEASEHASSYAVYTRSWDFENQSASEWTLLEKTTATGLFIELDVNELHAYRVTASNDQGESEAGTAVAGAMTAIGPRIADEDLVELMASRKGTGLVNANGKKPAERVQLGEVYHYQAMTAADLLPGWLPAGEIVYSLLQGPVGMSIDAASGVLSWTADVVGSFTVEIAAEDQGSQVRSTKTWTLESLGTVGVSDEPAFLDTTLFPNPASDLLTLRFHSRSAAVELRLLSLDAALLYSTSLRTSSGVNSHSIDLSGFAAGSYMLQLSNDAGTATLPLSISR